MLKKEGLDPTRLANLTLVYKVQEVCPFTGAPLPMHPHPPLFALSSWLPPRCVSEVLSASSRRRIPFTLLILQNAFSPFLHPGLTCNLQEVQPIAFRTPFHIN